jgi:hypothetical protein
VVEERYTLSDEEFHEWSPSDRQALLEAGALVRHPKSERYLCPAEIASILLDRYSWMSPFAPPRASSAMPSAEWKRAESFPRKSFDRCSPAASTSPFAFCCFAKSRARAW